MKWYLVRPKKVRCVLISFLVHTKKEVIGMSSKSREGKQRSYVYTTGFFGGLFASVVAYSMHLLNFIPFGPAVLLQYLPTYEFTPWMRGPLGHLIGITIISILSMLVAFLYYVLFRKMDTAWIGVWYGLALWVVVFLGLNQLIPGVKSVGELGWNTNITLVCIFIFYGLFVGYSISYEHKQSEYDKIT
jgi:hypothetical protein